MTLAIGSGLMYDNCLVKRDKYGTRNHWAARWPTKHCWDRQCFDWAIWFRLRKRVPNGSKYPKRSARQDLDRSYTQYAWRIPRFDKLSALDKMIWKRK